LVAKPASEVWDNHALLEKTRRYESLIYQKTFQENFTLKVAVISRSVEHLRNMVRALNTCDDEGYDIIMSRELMEVAEVSGKALVKFVQNDSSQIKQDLAQAIAELHRKLIGIRKEGLIRRFDSQKPVQVFSFYSSLSYFADDILAGLDELR
jgi:hypothetical protein